jgi:hypothetical protein
MLNDYLGMHGMQVIVKGWCLEAKLLALLVTPTGFLAGRS